MSPGGTTIPPSSTPVPTTEILVNYDFSASFVGTFDKALFRRQVAQWLNISDSDLLLEILQEANGTVVFHFYGPNRALYATQFLDLSDYERLTLFGIASLSAAARPEGEVTTSSNPVVLYALAGGAGALLLIVVICCICQRQKKAKEEAEAEELLHMPYPDSTGRV